MEIVKIAIFSGLYKDVIASHTVKMYPIFKVRLMSCNDPLNQTTHCNWSKAVAVHQHVITLNYTLRRLPLLHYYIMSFCK